MSSVKNSKKKRKKENVLEIYETKSLILKLGKRYEFTGGQTIYWRRCFNFIKHMKKCSTPLVIKKIQIKTIMSYHCIPTGMTIINKDKHNKCWDDVEKLQPSCFALGILDGTAILKNSLAFVKNVKHKFTI